MAIASLIAFAVLGAPRPPIDVKVLVLNYDPKVPSASNKRLTEVIGWNKPRELAKGYQTAIETASGGRVKFRIVEWRDINGFPTKVDGFRYDVEDFVKLWKAGKGFHDPDGTDYPKMVRDQRVGPLIDSGRIDEVWMFGGPYFGFWESSMAGPRAFYINGGVYEQVPTKRPFVVMGFNYERGVAEMIHDLCHRTEATMARVYGGWKAEVLDSNWAKFAANFKQSGGTAAVGTCHWPPNADSDYDYDNTNTVQSSADDWLNYPNLKGTKKPVNRETWGGPDYHLGYMKWWFAHLPRAEGVNKDGRLNDWWEYVFRFDAYDDKGKPRR